MNQRKNSVFSSLIYKFSERVLVKIIAFGIGILLARLIDPEIFGLLAILTVFTNLCQVFVQGGLNVALIQSKDTKEEDYSTVFWVSLVVAIFLCLLLFLTAPWIGRYYESEALVAPLRVLSLSLIAGAFNSIQTAKLSREMQFRRQLICNLIATLVSGGIGIAMAYAGLGLWALVAYVLLNHVIVCLCMLFAVHWFPRLIFSFTRAKLFFAYGWKILVSNLLFSLYTDIRSLVVGKVYTKEDLALYDRADQLPNMTSYNLVLAVQSVMLPALSKKQEDLAAVKEDLSRIIRYITYIISPILAGIAAVSAPFVYVFLNEKWAPCIPYMMVFCAGYVFMPIAGCCNVSIKAIGLAGAFAKNQTVRIITMFVILLVTLIAFRSVLAIVIGYPISQFLEMLIAVWPAKRHIGYSYRDVARDTLPNIALSFVMGCTVFALVKVIPNHLLGMLIGIPVGMLLYFFLSILTKNKAFYSLWKIVRSHLPHNKTSPF